jgi:hypothetical protein
MSELIFKNYKQRCSSLGNIMTNLPQPITEEEKVELANLLEECRSGVNANGNKTKWTDVKASRVKALQKKEKGEDELPSGAKTHLDDVFRSQFWKRRRHLTNKYLEKGLLCEQDILDIASKLDGDFYLKNDEHYSNEYIQGSWDNYSVKVRDAKANYDLKTFEEAELSSLYNWQIKGYSFMIKDKEKLSTLPEGELIYGLVNSPLHQITNEMTRQFYANGNPDDDSEDWLEIKRQIERNHIFDQALFKRDYPHYIFENKEWVYDIPAQFRIKKFEVTTTEEDVEHIKRRVLMSRIYLCNKEIEIYNKLKTT